MGFVTTPRLYRKHSGTYYLRIVVSASSSPSSTGAERRKRAEVCCSLRTKSPARARQIAAWANARLALDQQLHDKKFIVDALFSNIRRWTIGDLSIDGPEDAKNFVQTMRELPDLRAATMMRIANCTDPEQLAELQRLLATLSAQLPPPSGPSPAPHTGPAQPMRMLAAIDTYATSKQATAEVSARTARDKRNLLKALVKHLAAADPALGADPFVHDVTTRHLSSFLDAVPVRRHRSESLSDAEKAAAPKTVIKKISDLRAFFAYCHGELGATNEDPTVGLGKRRKVLNAVAKRQQHSYKPFCSADLERIFEPASYLAFNRDPDYFWAPLLSLHMGLRLKEIVTLRLGDIALDTHSETWFVKIADEHAKNANSSRRVPIPERLLELGFLDYVRHLRQLDASALFPHRDLDAPTAASDPSKNCSRTFGLYLGHLQFADKDLVFHSFRHTVVQALQDGGTPLADSMQLVGHQAQQHAMDTGKLTEQQARSVHLSNYSHAGEARMGVDSPLLRLKAHLDRCVRPPLNYGRLRIAARIVTEHTVFTAGRFNSGWPKLRTKYTDEQLARLKTG